MRAREFLPEAAQGFNDRKSSVMVKTLAFPSMPSNNPYLAYRFAMAMANHEIKNETGPTDEYAVISAYTKGEEEIIAAAVKKTGERHITVADKNSREPKTTNIASPVAQIKKNRFGV
jgi:hypothetical protein